MCGIATLISKRITKNEFFEFACSLVRNETRGGDSVGVAVNQGDNKIRWYHSFKPTAEEAIAVLEKTIQFDKPAIILGHTRLTATGTHLDAHPAYSKERRVWIVHNGVVESDMFNPRQNDTYAWADLIEEKDTVFLPELVRTIATAAFIFLLHKRQLYLTVYDKPMFRKKTENGTLFSQVVSYSREHKILRNGVWKEVDDGNYSVDTEDGSLTKLNQKIVTKRYISYLFSSSSSKERKDWNWKKYKIIYGIEDEEGV